MAGRLGVEAVGNVVEGRCSVVGWRDRIGEVGRLALGAGGVVLLGALW